MILQSFDSRWRDEISQFVNENGIRKEDIQTIFYDSERKTITLFYWSDTESDKIEDNVDGEIVDGEIVENTKVNKPYVFNTISDIFNKAFNKSTEDEGYNLYTNSEFFVFKKPYRMEVNAVTYEVETWKGVAQIFLKYLYGMNKSIFMTTDAVKNPKMFSFDPNTLYTPTNISDDFYFEGNRGVVDLFRVMSVISDEFNETLSTDVRENVKLFVV